MASVVSRRPQYQRGDVRPAKLLIVGGEGVRELGDYVSSYLSLRGDKVDRLMAFNPANRVSLYRVMIDNTNGHQSLAMDKGLMVGLSNSGLRYEGWLETGGSFLLDSSVVTMFPERSDINSIIVPASILAQTALEGSSERPEGLDAQELVGSVILGAVLAVVEEYPENIKLNRLFLNFHRPPVLPFVLATYNGYD